MSDYIPEDQLLQIFKFLPVKSLLRFRCVCKWWKEMIDSQSLMLERLSLQKPRLIVQYEQSEFLILNPQTLPLFDTMSYPIDTMSYPIEVIPRGGLQLVGTLHGLVCVYHFIGNNLLLWNPAIRKLLSLPLPEIMRFEWYNYDLSVGAYSAFWIDPCDKTYKIIIFQLPWDDKSMVGVDGVLYSSIQHDWRLVPMDELRSYTAFGDVHPITVMIEGVAYWRALRSVNDDETAVLLCFDFVQERFGVIEVPQLRPWNVYDKFAYEPKHYVLKDTLSLVYWDMDDPHMCDIYSRQDGEWVNMFRFNLVLLASDSLVTFFWAFGETKETCRFLSESYEPGGLLLYNAKDGCITTLKVRVHAPDHVDMERGPLGHLAYQFVESLLFPLT